MKRNGFFAMLARMKHITRWGLMRNSMKETLSEHSFDVAVIAHSLAVIGNTYFDKNIDAGQIAAAALFHDASEIITGDMPTPVKYNNPGIRQAFKDVEKTAVLSLVSMLPKEMAPKYNVLMNFDVEKPEFYSYIKAADKISAYIKCLEEEKSGNNEFSFAKRQTLDAVKQMNLPEADYFLDNFAEGYGLTLDELQGKGE